MLSRRVAVHSVVGSLASLSVAAGVLVAAPSALSKSARSSKQPIIFGAAVALTGYEEPYDKPPLLALELAAKAVNAKGGIDGRKIEFVTQDMQSKTSLGATAAEALLSKGASVLILPCDADLAGPGAEVGAQKHVLSFSLCESSGRLGPKTVGEYFYTPSQDGPLEGNVMAEWAHFAKHATKAFVVSDTSATYNISTTQGFVARWKGLHQKIVGQTDVTATDTTIGPTISAIKQSKPQVIWLGTETPEGAIFVRELRAAGIKQPILSNMGMDGTYWLKSVKNLSNFYYPVAGSMYGNDPSPALNKFVKQYAKKYGQPQTAYALFGPVILDLYKAAVQRAHSFSSSALVKALNTMRNTPTLLGPISYSSQAHIVLNLPMRVMQIQNGKPSPLLIWKVRKAPSLAISLS